ncbi:MAG: tetratricopeptide repeat protein [Acidobacteriota bacterium]|nr:MAG: tetratricopeptide repeat protein [Acidobacteriota bacterium]
MSFDKAKAMRNAERFVAQGKLRAAISEYRSVVDNDHRDVSTLNMLGDLYAKNGDKRDAVNCYMQVAEYYSTQGFAQKAIAVYNKVTKIQPDSPDVTAKLAELHRSKGSLSEARSHYLSLAEHYKKNGRRLEALAMYKQIALLDPNNTEVCLRLAESYLSEGQREEAIEAFAEAGIRLSRQNRHEEAIRALMKGYDLNAADLRVLDGLVKAQTALGRAAKAISLLEEIIESDPYNRDVLYLLIECCLESQNAAGAENAVVKLVEIEPANYPKFLDLIRIYLNLNDPGSAARILTMSAEYLLAGGQADECGKWISEILEREPLQLAGLRLLVRYNSWLNDENGKRLALERLYSAASSEGAVDDERFALSQLVHIKPHETRYRDRLNEIRLEYGDDDETSEEATEGHASGVGSTATASFEIRIERNGHETNGHEAYGELAADAVSVQALMPHIDASPLSLAAAERLEKELESVAFYIDNDYYDLAKKSIGELEAEFGKRPEIEELRLKIGYPSELHEEEVPASVIVEPHVEASAIGINEMRSELGIDDAEEPDGGDFETHYQMAVAYQEMGLFEDSIREYQDAIALVKPDDGTKRFYSCATLLGHCFVSTEMPRHAIKWLTRALETPEITADEYHGLWYELGTAYEACDDIENAAKYFDMIYAENVDFRDVGERVKKLLVTH